MYILIFVLPLVSKDPSKLALLVAGLIVIAAILAAAVGQAGIMIYARLAKGPKERAYLASASKFTRDGMKVLVGAIFPIMLVSLHKPVRERCRGVGTDGCHFGRDGNHLVFHYGIYW